MNDHPARTSEIRYHRMMPRFFVGMLARVANSWSVAVLFEVLRKPLDNLADFKAPGFTWP
ncbi:hypothetical protein QA633_24020 [Bradyrhizobium barranii]|uniref:hypothetical protein n=1 Tax=Bradyrhizobium barranii TaxID=2992140 RepID=UPI0024AFE0FC|nr:hypothetical protein [Bradyrhizobium barranii]WFT91434.1 hypothetical protein QA633_24020 [Bradyrhizobium barranii]